MWHPDSEAEPGPVARPGNFQIYLVTFGSGMGASTGPRAIGPDGGCLWVGPGQSERVSPDRHEPTGARPTLC